MCLQKRALTRGIHSASAFLRPSPPAQIVALLLEHDTRQQFPTLCGRGVTARKAIFRLLKIIRANNDDMELARPIQALLVWGAKNGMNPVIAVHTVTHVSSEEFCIDNCTLRGAKSWPQLYKGTPALPL